MANKLTKAERRALQQPPKPDKFTVALPSGGEAKITFTYGTDTIERKVHLVNGSPYVSYSGLYYPHGRFRLSAPVLLRDKKGKVVKVPLEVRACFVKIVMPDGTIMKARSCCKPPDVWVKYLGRKHALVNLFEQDKFKTTIHHGDRKTILEKCVPQLFPHLFDRPEKKKPTPIAPNTVMYADADGVLRQAPADMQKAAEPHIPSARPSTPAAHKAAKTSAKTTAKA